MTQTLYYQGQGKQQPEDTSPLPDIDNRALTDPAGYRASRELAAAVDVALSLGMPLLLTGEPGLGKSQLAHSLAWELGLGDVLAFTAKSDTQGTDLFYSFDTVGRFHAAQTPGADADPRRFITFNALGRAILKATSKDEKKRVRSVVLIDEIDKAPRDVPNDILSEIEQMHFKVPELAKQGEAVPEFKLTPEQNRNRPIVIITSNSEKGLPDPFLRRCVYHHIEFPDFDDSGDQTQTSVAQLVAARLGDRYDTTEAKGLVPDVIALFKHIRSQESGYMPSLAELLNLLALLLPSEAKSLKEIEQARRYAAIESTLFKNQAAQQKSKALLDEWFK